MSSLEQQVHDVLEVQLESGIDLRTKYSTERVANILSLHFKVPGVEREIAEQVFPYVVSWYERNMGRPIPGPSQRWRT